MTSSVSDLQFPHSTDWYTDDFIHSSVVRFLKDNGYKIHKENPREGERDERRIYASRFFKKEVIEVKGLHQAPSAALLSVNKAAHARLSVSEALFNSFINFNTVDNAEVAMAVPNVSRYQAIIEKLHDYFTFNDLYFRIYLVNEDGSVEVSNLNEKQT